jgi:1-acyl-sn-glycerol-3-phosphate acyltransferase
MTTTLSRLWKGLRFVAATLGWHGLYVLLRPLLRLPRRMRLRQHVFRGWARSIMRIIGMHARVIGPPPGGPFVLVTNHLSYLDIPLIASAIDGVFIAKSQVAGWPVMGRVCADMGTIFLKREDIGDIPRVSRLMEAALARGEGVVLFPEGTSSPGGEVMPFHPPLLAAAARLGVPVYFAALRYAVPAGHAPAHLSVCWWGEMEFTEHLAGLFALPAVEASLCFGDAPILDHNRKTLARSLHAAVSALFEPVVDQSTLARDRASLETQWQIRAQTNTSQRTSMS